MISTDRGPKEPLLRLQQDDPSTLTLATKDTCGRAGLPVLPYTRNASVRDFPSQEYQPAIRNVCSHVDP